MKKERDMEDRLTKLVLRHRVSHPVAALITRRVSGAAVGAARGIAVYADLRRRLRVCRMV
jgi:hypothetical protein